MASYAHILCATDFSEHSRRAVDRAADLARLHGARLTLLHVVEYLPEGFPVDVACPEIPDLESRLVARARESLATLAAGTGLPDVGLEVRISTRSARHEIVRYAGDNDVDLIVVASHGRHWVDALLGSTAGGVVRHAGCDVLAVRGRR